jgi:hypothetical protein
VPARAGWVGYFPGPGADYSEVGSVIDATGTVNVEAASLARCWRLLCFVILIMRRRLATDVRPRTIIATVACKVTRPL